MKSPGHHAMPDHKVLEQPLRDVAIATFDGATLAESSGAIQVLEDGAPPRCYFAREDVRMELLKASDTTTDCPFKGHATYFDLEVDGKKLQDAAWTYETPYDEHAALARRLAFYDDKYPTILVTVSGQPVAARKIPALDPGEPPPESSAGS